MQNKVQTSLTIFEKVSCQYYLLFRSEKSVATPYFKIYTIKYLISNKKSFGYHDPFGYFFLFLTRVVNEKCRIAT